MRLSKYFDSRKNSLFVGNPRGGWTAAILASFTSTCRRRDVDPQIYLTQLLVNLPSLRISELPDWLPDRWKAAQKTRLDALQNHAPVVHVTLTKCAFYKGGLPGACGTGCGFHPAAAPIRLIHLWSKRHFVRRTGRAGGSEIERSKTRRADILYIANCSIDCPIHPLVTTAAQQCPILDLRRS